MFLPQYKLSLIRIKVSFIKMDTLPKIQSAIEYLLMKGTRKLGEGWRDAYLKFVDTNLAGMLRVEEIENLPVSENGDCMDKRLDVAAKRMNYYRELGKRHKVTLCAFLRVYSNV